MTLFEIQNLDIITGAFDSVAPVLSDLRQDTTLPIVGPISLISSLEVITPIICLYEFYRVIFLEVFKNKICFS